MISVVERFFLNDLVRVLTHACISKINSRVVSFLLVHLSSRHVSRSAFTLLFNDEVRLSATEQFLTQQGILTYVFQNLLSVNVFFLPSCDVIICLFVLKTLQNSLVFLCDFHEFPFSGITVETSPCTYRACCLKSDECWFWHHEWIRRLWLWLLRATGCSSSVNLVGSLFLEYVCHLFKQYSVFPFYFSVSL